MADKSTPITWKIEVVVTNHLTSLEAFLKNYPCHLDIQGNTLILSIDNESNADARRAIVAVVPLSFDERRYIASLDDHEIMSWLLNNTDRIEVKR